MTEEDELNEELKGVIQKIKECQVASAAGSKGLLDTCASLPDVSPVPLRTRKILRGHLSKVNAVHYSGDSRHAVSCSLDGKLIIWDTWTGNKVQIIPLMSSWVMTAAFAPSGNMVAAGGMDNMCTIYDLKNKDHTGSARIRRELAGFEGFLSCCRFLGDNKIITGSADMKIVIWDLVKGTKEREFNGHTGDVITMSLHPDSNTFITGSVDRSIKLWDVREGSCRQTFWGHESDVNSVFFHRAGEAFATASDDKTSRLFDIRSDQELSVYRPPASTNGLTSCVLSTSGRLALCGSDDASVHIWDVLKGNHAGNLAGHEGRITSLSIADNGMAVVSSSWDTNLRVWN